MKLYATDDIAASVRVAHEQFTHIILNRGYTLIRPVFFKASSLNQLPVFQFASWIPATAGQLTSWKADGGVLIEQDTNPQAELTPDVTVLVECPYTMRRIEACCQRNAEYSVIPRPVSWKTHEECVDLRFPEAALLEEMFSICGGHEITNKELANEIGLPVTEVQYMKNALKPVELWYIQKRLAPERDEFVPAWDWLEAKTYTKPEINASGFKSQIEEMARFGYVGLKKIFRYPGEKPDWRRLDKKREEALRDLASVRLLVESLEIHPGTSEPSGESP